MADHFLFLSTTATRLSTLVEGIAGLGAEDPGDLMITVRWVTTDTHKN